MDTYDGDGDGELSAEELAACSALQGAMTRVDSNNNKLLSNDEIAQRIKAYQEQSEFVGTSIRVKLGDRPVTEATVVFEPEPFMGENGQSYTGKSDDQGIVRLVGENRETPGLPLGFYKVRITRAGGEETHHGCEIADDAPSAGRLIFSLDD
ncbi:MAG: hypothetical protein ACR2NU_04985 [Aeoliella sp.]